MIRLQPLESWRQRLFEQAIDITEANARRPAVVFAPHQDDETLGCGGVIRQKRDAGTPVSIVFFTDGHTSHQHLMEPAKLSEARREEALKAATILGVEASDVHFLNYPDSRLASCEVEAIEEARELLNRIQPAEVYAPFARDVTPDHEAAYRIAEAAALRSGLSLLLMEYPLWCWNQWPAVGLRLSPSRATLKALLGIAKSRMGAVPFHEFEHGVSLSPETLEIKKKALAAHRTQMEEVLADCDWPTLGGVSEGDFLKCLLQPCELFRCRDVAFLHPDDPFDL